MKQITHEEAYKAYCNCVIGQDADYVNKNHLIVKEYFTQQEKKDKLLELYQEKEKLQEERDSININPLDYQQHPLTISIRYIKNQIKALEEELK